MYIGNLCDSGRFHSMGFLKTSFINDNLDFYALCLFRNKVILILKSLNQARGFSKYLYENIANIYFQVIISFEATASIFTTSGYAL